MSGLSHFDDILSDEDSTGGDSSSTSALNRGIGKESNMIGSTSDSSRDNEEMRSKVATLDARLLKQEEIMRRMMNMIQSMTINSSPNGALITNLVAPVSQEYCSQYESQEQPTTTLPTLQSDNSPSCYNASWSTSVVDPFSSVYNRATPLPVRTFSSRYEVFATLLVGIASVMQNVIENKVGAQYEDSCTGSVTRVIRVLSALCKIKSLSF
jgi:hypothetical protein